MLDFSPRIMCIMDSILELYLPCLSGENVLVALYSSSHYCGSSAILAVHVIITNASTAAILDCRSLSDKANRNGMMISNKVIRRTAIELIALLYTSQNLFPSMYPDKVISNLSISDTGKLDLNPVLESSLVSHPVSFYAFPLQAPLGFTIAYLTYSYVQYTDPAYNMS